MASQTGSIDLTASNAVKLAAEAGWQSDLDSYYTKSEIDVTVGGINSTVSTKVGEDEVISSINQSSESVSINANKINLTGAVTISDLSSDAQSATLNSNISVGGRNLLQDSKFTTAFNAGWWTLDGLSATLSDNKLVIDGSVAATGNKRVYQSTVRFSHVKGITYTFSCDIVATAACQVSFGRRYGTTNNYGVTFNVTTTSQRISGTYTTTSIGAFCISEVSNSATVTISNPKLEIGNVATDWTPAPEDVDSAISDAAKTATSYATDITGGGVMVHPSDDVTTGVQITSDVDIMRDGTSVINIGTNDAVRIGVDDSAHVKMLLESDEMSIENESGSEIFSIDSGSTGSATVTLTAILVTWDTTASVDTNAHPVGDTGTAAGTTTVTATINGLEYPLGTTYATATVTAGTGVSVALTQAGVTYVQGLMVVTVEEGESTVTTTYPCELSVEYKHAVTDKALLSLIGNQTITGEGEVLYIVNDKWTSTRRSGTLIRMRNATTGRAVLLGVGTDGYNRGVWDVNKGNWIIARDVNGKTVIGGDNFSVNSSGYVYSHGEQVSGGLLVNNGWAKNRITNWSSSNQKNTFWWSENTVTGERLGFGVADSGYNRGIWDSAKNRWIVVKSQTDVVSYYGIYSNFERVSYSVVSGETVNAGNQKNGTTNITRSGMYPLGVVGWTSNSRFIVPVRFYISNAAVGSGTINWLVYNLDTNDRTPTINVVILWARGD